MAAAADMAPRKCLRDGRHATAIARCDQGSCRIGRRAVVLGPSQQGTPSMTATPRRPPDRELSITRLIDAPRHALYRCWTEPELLKQWFAPLPFTTPLAELDVRPGGAGHIVMRGPDGRRIRQSRRLSRGRAEREARVHRRLYRGVAAVGKPFMTAHRHLRRRGRQDALYGAACSTGRSRIARRTRRWASTRAGAPAPTSALAAAL